MRRKIVSVFLTVCVLLLIPMTAFAQVFDGDRTGSVSVSLMDPNGRIPIAGAELSLYHVATVSLNSENNLSYSFTDGFRDCGFTMGDPDLSVKLDAFVKDHAVSPVKLVTDARGKVTFPDLPLGLYFVKQTNTVAGYAPCTSFLVTVPNHNADGYVYDVDASPKTDVAKITDITLRKVWNTGGSSQVASSVTVQLLKDGVVVETATLSSRNNWQVTYQDMPESDGYSILEINVPRGFTATYSRSGYVFTVTNSASLAQTGQLVWPIPVLAMAGLSLIAIGTVVLRKPRDRNA